MKCEYKKNEKWTVNDIGDEGAAKISESLMTNTTLTELELWTSCQIMTSQFIHYEKSVCHNENSFSYICEKKQHLSTRHSFLLLGISG